MQNYQISFYVITNDISYYIKRNLLLHKKKYHSMP